MKIQIVEKVKELFAQGRIAGFVAPRLGPGGAGPHVFTRPDELDELHIVDTGGLRDVRYPLIKLLGKVVEAYPNESFAILVRGCDERALELLETESRVSNLSPDRVIPIGLACSEERAAAHECSKPWPDCLVAGEPTRGVRSDYTKELDDPLEALAGWDPIFKRCLKCFGCRNSCPVCDCHDCTMEIEAFIPQRELPSARSFLLTRAVHMVDRCVYCGKCEDACPADIPLRSLYRIVAQAMGRDDLLAGLPGPPAKETWTMAKMRASE